MAAGRGRSPRHVRVDDAVGGDELGRAVEGSGHSGITVGITRRYLRHRRRRGRGTGTGTASLLRTSRSGIPQDSDRWYRTDQLDMELELRREYNAVSDRVFGSASPGERQRRDSHREPRKRRAGDPDERRGRHRRSAFHTYPPQRPRREAVSQTRRRARPTPGRGSDLAAPEESAAPSRPASSWSRRRPSSRTASSPARRRRSASSPACRCRWLRSAIGRRHRLVAARRSAAWRDTGLVSLRPVAIRPWSLPVRPRTGGTGVTRPSSKAAAKVARWRLPRSRGRAVSHEYRRGRASRLRAPAARRAAGCLSSSHFLSSPRCSTWPGVWRSIASRRRRDTAAASRTTRASAPPSTTSSRGAGPAELDHGRSTTANEATLCHPRSTRARPRQRQARLRPRRVEAPGRPPVSPLTSGQSAGGSSGASQYGPTNGAMSIRVLSPGNDGAVTQSNTTTAGAIAANANTTSQSTDQSQTGGGYGSRLHTGRRPGGEERAVGGCRREGGAGCTEQRRPVDPRSQPR